MEERQAELFWLRAEQWVNDRSLAQFQRGGRVLCPMCAILPVAGAFRVRGVLLVLCLPCAKEAQSMRRKWLDDAG